MYPASTDTRRTYRNRWSVGLNIGEAPFARRNYSIRRSKRSVFECRLAKGCRRCRMALPMNAILLEKPEHFTRTQIPEPAAPGAGEAVVRVHRVGICGSDV